MRELENYYDYHRSAYIYNPLDTVRIRQQAKEKINDMPFAGSGKKDNAAATKTIISVGRNDPIKGFWHLVKAFSAVYRKHPEARLVILGTGDWSGLERLAEELGVGEAVAFPGLRRNPFPYVAASDLYVLSSNHEGFPNALLEAMALGKPCIAADCKTGPREIVLSEDEYKELITNKPDGSSVEKVIDGAFGVLVPDMSPDPDLDASHTEEGEKILAEEICRMFEDETRMESYARMAQEHSLIYQPEKYAETLKGILG
jgi:N-acetylgalactosamine-N,N'-diacetylbacillosaminyl-diphospho-undecaprenol 4-alpha-N-acetylgalactosaminyltransferase